MTSPVKEYRKIIPGQEPPLCLCGCGLSAPPHKNKPRYYCNYILGHSGYKRLPLIEAQPFKINGVNCRLIPLSQGLHTIVWEIHYGFLMQWKWSAIEGTNGFYARRGVVQPNGTRRLVSMQNVLMPPEPDHTIDHISGCTLDNRYDNFRQATASQQCQNTSKRKHSRYAYRGVKKSGPSFWARVNGIYRGPFATELEAAIAHDSLARGMNGEFARLNFSQNPPMLDLAHAVASEVVGP